MSKKLSQQEINLLLKHPILSGNEFNQYVDAPKNEKIKLEIGDTFYTVEIINKFINKYYHQVSRLAKVLQKSDLSETIRDVHQFVRSHIQYEIDESLQRMRTPSNIWQNRKLGTDCKGYTTFAGALLKSMGISFYIRQIKQEAHQPDLWTHVFIVVPLDQKTGDLNKGNLILDGTMELGKHPKIKEKHDVFMQKLEHIGLNAPAKSKKKPTAKQLEARKKFAKMAKDGTLKKLRKKSSAKGLNAPKTKTARKLCSSVIVKDGLKKDGTLKKGYKYAAGGKIVKVKTTASKSRSKGLNAPKPKAKAKGKTKKSTKKPFPF